MQLRALLPFVLPLVGAASSGCAKAPESALPFNIVVTVWSDPGHPLQGARIMKSGKAGPSTGLDGKVAVKLTGNEGDVVELMVSCPSDFISPTKPIPVLLRRNMGAKPAEYDASCPPAIRQMVVAVRADNGAHLPVKILGQTVGYTDANGAFTYTLALHPGDGVEMTLDTTDRPRMTPRSPSALLTMQPYDDVVTFNQRFHLRTPAAPPTRVRRGPTRF
jgi:hypothetical protein